MVVVGEFLQIVFNNHSLPKHRVESFTMSLSISGLPLSPKPTQLLHYCPGYSQAQLICLIISIFDGVPEAFEVYRCHPMSTEEELSLFVKRVTKHQLQYLILEVNRLPFKLQEVCMYHAMYSDIMEHFSFVVSPLHFMVVVTSSFSSYIPPFLHLFPVSPFLLSSIPLPIPRSLISYSFPPFLSPSVSDAAVPDDPEKGNGDLLQIHLPSPD